MLDRKAFCAMVVLTVLVLTSSIQVARAVDYRVGVKAGDTADYSITEDGPPPLMGSISGRLEVMAVSGTNVTYRITQFNVTGGVTGTGTTVANISMWGTNLTYFSCFVSAGLTKGDRIWANSFLTFNYTGSMNFAGETRAVNILFYVLSAPETVTLVYDRDTGVMLEFVVQISSSWQAWMMTSTNMWGGGTDATALALVGLQVEILALVVAVVALAIIVKRKK